MASATPLCILQRLKRDVVQSCACPPKHHSMFKLPECPVAAGSKEYYYSSTDAVMVHSHSHLHSHIIHNQGYNAGVGSYCLHTPLSNPL